MRLKATQRWQKGFALSCGSPLRLPHHLSRVRAFRLGFWDSLNLRLSYSCAGFASFFAAAAAVHGGTIPISRAYAIDCPKCSCE